MCLPFLSPVFAPFYTVVLTFFLSILPYAPNFTVKNPGFHRILPRISPFFLLFFVPIRLRKSSHASPHLTPHLTVSLPQIHRSFRYGENLCFSLISALFSVFSPAIWNAPNKETNFVCYKKNIKNRYPPWHFFSILRVNNMRRHHHAK